MKKKQVCQLLLMLVLVGCAESNETATFQSSNLEETKAHNLELNQKITATKNIDSNLLKVEFVNTFDNITICYDFRKTNLKVHNDGKWELVDMEPTSYSALGLNTLIYPEDSYPLSYIELNHLEQGKKYREYYSLEILEEKKETREIEAYYKFAL